MATPHATSSARAVIAVVGLYAISLGLICLWPQHVDLDFHDVVQAVLAATGLSYDELQFGANVVLFVPLGILGARLVRDRATALLVVPFAGLAISALLEDVQAAFLPGRSADVGDIIANTLGAIIGCLVVVGLQAAAAAVARRVAASAIRRAHTPVVVAPLGLLRAADVAPSSSI